MNDIRPNIIFITFDEMRRDSLGCYGGQVIKTPNIDALAAQSIKFNGAYTPSPWCLPARSAILTGLYPHNNGAYSNFRDEVLSPEMPNLFNQLQGGGYHTAMVGKCHFSPLPYDDIFADRTLENDFEEYYKTLGIDDLFLNDGKSASVWFYDTYSRWLEKQGYLAAYREKMWNYEIDGSVFDFPGPAYYHPDSWVGNTASEYISEYDNDKPMFAWVSFSGPHYPYDAPVEYLDRVDVSKIPPMSMKEGEFDDPSRIHHASYNGPDGKGPGIDATCRAPEGATKNFSQEYWDKLRLNYYANVAQIDDMVGKVLDSAKKKFGDNTLIILTVDHGELLGDHGLWGKNDCAYEQVWKIPLLVKYPCECDNPMVTDAMANTLDVLPTCLKAAGILPIECDGKDYKELIEEGGYKYIFAEGEGYIAVTDGTCKYIHVSQKSEFRELLDISIDPEEFNNYIDDPAHVEKVSELREQVISHFFKKVLP